VSSLPILYSFRRCPYAIRARMALVYSGVGFELWEVVLKNKPQEMLNASPKGTVPVLILPNDTVIDESWDVMKWALSNNDPDDWMLQSCPEFASSLSALIQQNDLYFKGYLDRYKYADRYPEHTMEYYREQGETFLLKLDEQLQSSPYLFGEQLSVADVAIMPFIRQFAHVDINWFRQTPYKNLQLWLDKFLQSTLFNSVMKKYPPWEAENKAVLFP
jgi:glutathione S-transferase